MEEKIKEFRDKVNKIKPNIEQILKNEQSLLPLLKCLADKEDKEEQILYAMAITEIIQRKESETNEGKNPRERVVALPWGPLKSLIDKLEEVLDLIKKLKS